MQAQQHRGGGGGDHSFRASGQALIPLRQASMSLRQAPMGPRPVSAPVERRPPAYAAAQAGQGRSQLAPIERRDPQAHGVKGEHLAQWMNQHSNLTPQQQQQALDREPGFHDLPQETQQRMHNRLTQLDGMTPEQRQRVLAHTEMVERMTPDQRVQFRGAMQQLGSLPPDQRHAVARSFRELRGLPPEQRAGALNSGRYRWMNATQRGTLNNLLRIEPLLPPPER
jgi:hypothetical protein